MKTNPYLPPQNDLLQGDDDNDEPAAGLPESMQTVRPFFVLWAVVFFFNLIVPLLFAMMVTNVAAKLGMVFGIALFLIAGGYLGLCNRRCRDALIRGGSVTAVSQFMPILQMFSGLVAIEICKNIGLTKAATDVDPTESLESVIGGFFATMLTGCMISIVALVLGWLMTIGHSKRKPKST